MEHPVIIVDYDPNWPIIYQHAADELRAALGVTLASIEHIGSTSIPGLAAKPIIDIMLGLYSLNDADDCIPHVEALGYTYSPESEIEFPERRYFDRFDLWAYHLHTVAIDSDFWERHLLFRDYLRAHPEAMCDYAELKRGLAEQFRGNRSAYTNAKTDFISSIEAAARKERS